MSNVVKYLLCLSEWLAAVCAIKSFISSYGAKSSMELAQVTYVTGRLKKKKTSEKIAVLRLLMESTNMSVAVKYLLCRREWLASVRGIKSSISSYEAKVFG